MAKNGMKRPEYDRKKNDVPPVPQINGKAKHGHNKAAPLISDGEGKVWHSTPHPTDDLSFDNMVNDLDITAADLQDFWRKW